MDILRNGYTHLVDVSLLREASEAGCGFVTWNQLAAIYRGEKVLTDTLSMARGESAFAIGEDVAALPCAEALVPPDYHLVMVLLVVPQWLLRTRRVWRAMYYENTPYEQLCMDIGTTADTIADFAEVTAAWPGATGLYVDARDYPYREITREESLRIVAGGATEMPEPPGLQTDYHKIIRLRGELWGSVDEEVAALTAARLDAILPEDMTGQCVLDVGTSKGLFAWEALHRGAAQVLALECDAECIAFMQQVRDAQHFAVSTCHLDITQYPPPISYLHGKMRRYDTALLLNILHWCGQPEAILASVLAVCERCVIETPFCCGTEVRRDPHGTWIEGHEAPLRCLPPWWIEQQAEAHGFRVAAMRNSPIYPGYRIVMRLERVT